MLNRFTLFIESITKMSRVLYKTTPALLSTISTNGSGDDWGTGCGCWSRGRGRGWGRDWTRQQQGPLKWPQWEQRSGSNQPHLIIMTSRKIGPIDPLEQRQFKQSNRTCAYEAFCSASGENYIFIITGIIGSLPHHCQRSSKAYNAGKAGRNFYMTWVHGIIIIVISYIECCLIQVYRLKWAGLLSYIIISDIKRVKTKSFKNKMYLQLQRKWATGQSIIWDSSFWDGTFFFFNLI